MMEDEEDISELKIVETKSLISCDVENCRASGVSLVKASLPALQYYFSHIENYENLSVNICLKCLEKVDFFKSTKESILKGDCLLAIKDIPEFLKIPTEVIDIDCEDDKSRIPLHPPNKRKGLDDNEELDQVIRKVLKKIDIPKQLSKGAALIKGDMDRLEKEMKLVSNDIHHVLDAYNSRVRQILGPVEIVTTRETTIDSDGTVTKRRVAPYPSARMERFVGTDNAFEIIREIIMLDKEPQDEELDDDEIEQISVEKPEVDGRILNNVKGFPRRLPEVGWAVIARFRDGAAKQDCWVRGKVLEASESDGLVVEFSVREAVKRKVVPLTKVAYCELGDFVLPPKLRVVVAVEERSSCVHAPSVPHYQPGIIIESKRMVTYDSSYLVYLDNGQCRYVPHKNVRIMCDGRFDEFLRERLWRYPETDEYFKYVIRRLANGEELQRVSRRYRNGLVVVLRNDKWQVAEIEVGKVDDYKSDVVKVQFEGAGQVEYLFRGSPRFYQVLVLPNFGPEPKVEYSGWWGEEEKSKREMLLDLEYQENRLASCLGFEGLIKTLEPPVQSVGDRHNECGETCVPKYTPSDQWKCMSPLAVPLHFGWQRRLSSLHRKHVVYVSPCGRKRINNFKTLFEYLRITKSNWEIDWFCFEVDVDCCKVFVTQDVRLGVEDISGGCESVPIPCINSVDEQPIPVFKYVRECEVGPEVEMMPAQEFLQCCDCTDNCSNYSLCACRRLTVEGWAEAVDGVCGPVEKWFSYVKNRKLMYNFDSGVFECGERCACQKNLCTNRVVGNGMRWPLLVFKTRNKGWAVRTTCDIPKGTFICVYAGALNTEEKGLKIGNDSGNEYSLSLVFLKRFELYNRKYKEGYESFVIGCEDDEDESEEEPEKTRDETLNGRKSLQNWFPVNQQNFMINPKQVGNIGRFFSHSCKPNLFLQHIFVNSHDPRFPQHAFFTKYLVKAGSELTWHYGYQSNGTGDVKIICQCGAPNCVKRQV